MGRGWNGVRNGSFAVAKAGRKDQASKGVGMVAKAALTSESPT